MDIKNLIGRIPEVEYPKEGLSIEDRIKWTVGIAVLVLIMGTVPLPMSPDTLTYSYPFLFTMIAIGIGPIVTAVLILQILLAVNIIRLDLGKLDDRLFFYGIQKILIVFFAFFEAAAVVIGFHLANTLGETMILMSILILGVISLTYMDEIVVKWGLGSGLGLFISVGAIKMLLYILFNPMSDGWGIHGVILNFLNILINQSIFDISLIFPVIVIAVISIIIYMGLKKKTEFPISTESVSGKYSMKFFYVSYLPLSFVGGLIANLGMFPLIAGINLYSPPLLEQMNTLQQAVYTLVRNLTLGELYGLFSPENWHMLLDLSVLIHLLLYSGEVILLSLIFGYILAILVGLDEFYMKQSPKVEIIVGNKKGQELENKMRRMIVTSSLAVGMLLLVSDLLGIIVGFVGVLITVGYLQRCYEEIKGPKKVCPNCGSLGIEWLLPDLWSIWECRNCGYRGTIVVDVEG